MTRQNVTSGWHLSEGFRVGSLNRHNATPDTRPRLDVDVRSRAMDDVAVLKFKNQQLGGQVRSAR